VWTEGKKQARLSLPVPGPHHPVVLGGAECDGATHLSDVMAAVGIELHQGRGVPRPAPHLAYVRQAKAGDGLVAQGELVALKKVQGAELVHRLGQSLKAAETLSGLPGLANRLRFIPPRPGQLERLVSLRLACLSLLSLQVTKYPVPLGQGFP